MALVGTALAACGDDASTPSPDDRSAGTSGEGTPPAESSTEGPSEELTPEGAPGEVAGIAISVSDVEGEPNVPLGGEVWALAVPSDLEAELWERTAFDEPPPDERLPYTSAAVEAGALADEGAELSPIGDDGRFTLDVDAGGFLVCVVRGEEPTGLEGCGRVDLEPGAATELGRGEGGTTVKRIDDGGAAGP